MADRIAIDDLEVSCIIGVLPAERTTPQPLVLSVCLELTAGAVPGAAATGDLARTVDYAQMAASMRQALVDGAFHLLEEAATVLAELGLREAPVAAVTVRLAKPRALGGNGVPSVLIRRAKAPTVGPAFQGARK